MLPRASTQSTHVLEGTMKISLPAAVKVKRKADMIIRFIPRGHSIQCFFNLVFTLMAVK